MSNWEIVKNGKVIDTIDSFALEQKRELHFFLDKLYGLPLILKSQDNITIEINPIWVNLCP